MSNQPLALGIHWSHDASVALCSPDGLLFSIAEERIRRLKHYCGFPSEAIRLALLSCGVKPQNISLLAFSADWVLYPSQHRSWMVDLHGVRSQQSLFLGQRLFYPWQMRRAAKKGWGEYSLRHFIFYESFLRELGLLRPDVSCYYVDHHRAHASSAFRFSGQRQSTVMTMDGKGGGVSATIYKGEPDGSMTLLRSSAAKDSLGALYQAITEVIGFVPVEGEYKTMGLAATTSGNKKKNPFSSVISVQDGRLHSTIPWTYRSYNAAHPQSSVPNPLNTVAQAQLYEQLLTSYRKEELAYFVQETCEQVMTDYAQEAMKITGCSSLCAAGGVMLNVKGNACIRDRLKPKEFFVYPDAADSGLAAGAAMEALYQERSVVVPGRLPTAYLGNSYGEKEIAAVLKHYTKNQRLKIEKITIPLLVKKIIKGQVIGTFQGRMEMGPRALGNRSVLADPRVTAVKERINALLKGREDFIPFAPMVLEEEANRLWKGSSHYPFMTFTVMASAYAKKTVPAVVHTDGTMRPQVVTKTGNPWAYRLLLAFKKKTGVGVLLNTSFNRHGLPIVFRPEDALDHLLQGWVDAVVIDGWYVTRGK